MGWNIPEPLKYEEYKPISWGAVTGAFSALFTLLVTLWTVYYSVTKSTAFFPIAVFSFGVLLLFFLLILGWRLYRIGIEAERRKSIDLYNQENKIAWQQWASKSVGILGIGYIFPRSFPKTFFTHDEEFSINEDKKISLGNYPGEYIVFRELIVSIKHYLDVLPDNVKLEIWLPYENLSQQSIISAVWSDLDLSHIYIESYNKLNNYTEQIASWVDNPDDSIKLVMIPKWSSVNEKESDGLIAWVISPSLTNKDYNNRFSLYRPMETEYSELTKPLNDFFFYQQIAVQSTGLWNNKIEQSVQTEVLMGKHKVSMGAVDKKESKNSSQPEVYTLSHWLGSHNSYAFWFTMTVAMLMSEKSQSCQLCLSEENSKLSVGAVSYAVNNNYVNSQNDER
ncbi:hypothetical protein [Xenorhabdus szentirmaii]|uniref:hypothetical protein n=1 Tax=Xenorhabdus szentirmaii TaxID=290112 RepID=UPI0019BF11CA|nr:MULTISPECIES: hypothetical protein [unclassified Xenorhabdus]MBD2792984.1 hypothetical protein [Xenorhabdus sp. CUL]MBD2806728.1 hypothetical protein [Xenorhabdus sp. ZM]MBD2827046.1 hypothetical protein [Xenorhabdus sp. 5]